MKRSLCAMTFTISAALCAHPASAQTPPAPDEPPAAPEAAPAAKPPPPPYSLPWQLRPAAAASVIRSDTALAFSEDATGSSHTAVASMLLASYKVADGLAPFIRLGVVGAADAFSFVNPAAGATYVIPLPEGFRLALFLGLTAPIGMGGGDSPDPDVAAATKAGILARSAMDNAMYAVDYFTVFPGVDVAWVAHGLTLQAEATLLQLIRVRGAAVQKDSTRTNFTAGFHAGYFLIPQLSLGAEIRHQRWLSTPAAVEADPTGATRDNTTFAVGPRAHFKLGESVWFRPGIAYARGIDKPMADPLGYNIVQIDLPLQF
ncbi:MAG: hypothetical protein IT372_33505 [Polyangiaceae bacterium]|nr:hypothetical protein [Polyangiaceae bacterium]